MKSNITITRNGHVLTATKYNHIRNTYTFLGDYDGTKKHHYFDSVGMFVTWAGNEAYLDRVEFINYK